MKFKLYRKTNRYYFTNIWLALLMFLSLGISSPTAIGEIGSISPDYTGSWTDSGNHVTPSQDATGAYLITKPEELADVATGSGRYNTSITLSLQKDIDLGAHEWVPINLSTAITFQGNGHTISNLHINQPNKDNVGLFGNLSGTVFFYNINLANVKIVGKQNVGAFLGYNSNGGGQLTNYNVSSGSVFGYGSNIGGIAGYDKYLGLSNCKNYATVNSYADYVGGITGATSSATIQNAYNGGTVKGVKYVGGIVGNIEYAGNLYDSLAECTVLGDSSVGGLVGANAGSSIKNSGFRGTLQISSTAPNYIGGIQGGVSSVNNASISNSFAVSEVYLNSVDDKSVNQLGAPLTDIFNSNYAETRIIYKTGVATYKRFRAGETGFKSFVYHPQINGGYPFVKTMFAIGGILPEQDVAAYLGSYGFLPGLNIQTLKNSTYGTDKYIKFGQYPQSYVGESMNNTLESWYNGQPVVDTYSVDNGINTSPAINVFNAYTFRDGITYVRVPSPHIINSPTYQNGTSATTSATWFKVEPIRWLLLNYTDILHGADPIFVAERILAGNISWVYKNSSGSGVNMWSTGASRIRSWLNETFYQDAFESKIQGEILNTYVQNNSQDSDDDGTDYETPDKVWLLSYNESNKYFTASSQRCASPTDFAIANYVGMTLSNQTSARPNGGGGIYWLRSAKGTQNVYSVGPNGDQLAVIVWNGSALILPAGVRPALTLDRISIT